jgi:acyl-homoserine lactone acylase PvdQ
LSRFLKTVGRRLDADPRAAIEPGEQRFVDAVLAAAWNSCQRVLGPDPKDWNSAARRRVTERKLGYYESLDGFPSLDASQDLPCPALNCPDRGTVFSQEGQAYVQWVPLTQVDDARSLLPPGNSERPADPMRRANVERWVRGELNAAPLSREAVERIAESRRVLPGPVEPETALDE